MVVPDSLRRALEVLYPLGEALPEALGPLLHEGVYGRGGRLSVRDQPQALFFVASGLVKGVWNDSLGQEYITRFWPENEFILLKNPARREIPRTDQLVMLEKTRLIRLSEGAGHRLLGRFGEARALLVRLCLRDRDRADQAAFLARVAPQVAYDAFIRHYPAHRIPVGDMARFLGISRRQLSRIRRRR